MAFLRGGAGKGLFARVTGMNRQATAAVSIPFSGEASRLGRLYGVGTGSINPTSGGERSVLWFRNDSNINDLVVTDLIFGWDGGTSSGNKTILSLIYYNTGVPSGNNTSIDAQVENIRFSQGSDPGTLNDFTAHKWDGGGTGMTSGSGGFAQIPNRLGIGNTSLDINNEIVLGKGNAMEFRVTPAETGLFNVAAVFAVVPRDEGYEGIL